MASGPLRYENASGKTLAQMAHYFGVEPYLPGTVEQCCNPRISRNCCKLKLFWTCEKSWWPADSAAARMVSEVLSSGGLVAESLRYRKGKVPKLALLHLSLVNTFGKPFTWKDLGKEHTLLMRSILIAESSALLRNLCLDLMKSSLMWLSLLLRPSS